MPESIKDKVESFLSKRGVPTKKESDLHIAGDVCRRLKDKNLGIITGNGRNSVFTYKWCPFIFDENGQITGFGSEILVKYKDLERKTELNDLNLVQLVFNCEEEGCADDDEEEYPIKYPKSKRGKRDEDWEDEEE